MFNFQPNFGIFEIHPSLQRDLPLFGGLFTPLGALGGADLTPPLLKLKVYIQIIIVPSFRAVSKFEVKSLFSVYNNSTKRSRGKANLSDTGRQNGKVVPSFV